MAESGVEAAPPPACRAIFKFGGAAITDKVRATAARAGTVSPTSAEAHSPRMLLGRVAHEESGRGGWERVLAEQRPVSNASCGYVAPIKVRRPAISSSGPAPQRPPQSKEETLNQGHIDVLAKWTKECVDSFDKQGIAIVHGAGSFGHQVGTQAAGDGCEGRPSTHRDASRAHASAQVAAEYGLCDASQPWGDRKRQGFCKASLQVVSCTPPRLSPPHAAIQPRQSVCYAHPRRDAPCVPRRRWPR